MEINKPEYLKIYYNCMKIRKRQHIVVSLKILFGEGGLKDEFDHKL